MDKDLIFIQTILSDEMISQGFPLVYKGPLNHQTMKFFTRMAEEKISKRCSDSSIKRKVFHVMVEMLQNITRHSADYDEEGSGNGIFVIGERRGYYYIITANVVRSSDVKELEHSIETLNRMDKDELDNMHKTQIKTGELSVKGGAGLGLIDIIRKTGEKYAYQFLRLDENYHFFVLKSTIHF
ncbi:MAG: SiaB family protein kinase [Bacteroidales bacterium]|nr:SiaB family protein kinase [Bacteroidales bacterium]